MRGEGGLAAEFDALGFRIGPAPRRALGDASAFELRRDAKHGENKPDVVSTTGSAIERRPAPARCMSRAITRRSVVSRESRSTAGVITTSPGASFLINLPSGGRSAVVPVIFSRNIFLHPAALSWRTWPLSSWAAVETRA